MTTTTATPEFPMMRGLYEMAYEIEVRGDCWHEGEERFKERRITYKCICAVNSRLAMQKAIEEFMRSVGNDPKEPVIHNIRLINTTI